MREISTRFANGFRRFVATAAMAALFAPALLRAADPEPIQIKPLAVLAIASFDELRKDGDHLARLAGQPGLPTLPPLPGDGGKAQVMLEALDGSRPAGGAVYLTADGSFGALGFIPVKSKKAFLDAVDEAGLPLEEADEPGVWKAGSAYFKLERNYLFVAPAVDQLEELPDPAQVLGRLLERYDLGLSLGVKNVPGFLRQAFASQVDAGIDAAASDRIGEPGGPANEEEAEEIKKFAKLYMKQLVRASAELDRIDYGIAVDRKQGKIFLESVVVPKLGTSLAKSYATVRDFPTVFPAFRDPDLPVSMHYTSTHGDPESKAMMEAFGSMVLRKMREEARKELDKPAAKFDENGEPIDRPETPPEVKKLGEEYLELLEQSLRDVWEKGRFDAGFMLRLREGGGPQFLGAAYIPGAKRFEALMFRALDLLKEKAKPEELAQAPEIKRNHAKVKGVDLHLFAAPKEVKDEKLDEVRKWMGGDPEGVFGFGEDVVWFGFGADVVPAVRAAIERTDGKRASPGGSAVDVSLKRLLDGLPTLMELNKDKGREYAAELRKTLAALPSDKDRVRILFEVGPQDEGIYRLEVQEGLVLFGAALGRSIQEKAAREAEAERIEAEKAQEKVQ